MHIENLADPPRVGAGSMRFEYLLRVVRRQICARHDAVRHAATFAIGDRLKPARFLDGIGGIVIGIDMHELEHVNVLCITQQIA